MARLTRAEQQQATRARLLDAAERVFVARGFHATSVEDVADEAGFSKGAVYSNFQNKDDLFLALLERRIDDPLLGLESEIDAGRPLADQTRAAGSLFVEMTQQEADWNLLLMEYATHAARRPELRERFVERNRRMRAAMVPLIDTHVGQLGLRVPLPSEHLAAMLFVLGSGFMLERLVDPDGIPEDLFGQALTLMMSALVPREAPSPRGEGATRSRSRSKGGTADVV